jgi:Tol biopolymer transport system component
MDSPDVMAIPASEGAVAPAFSPDGQWLVYSQEIAVKKHAIRGGSSVTLVQQHSRLGTSWSSDGTSILLASLGAGGFLRRVSAEGGETQRIPSPSDTDSARNYAWPQALPGGDAVLFTAIGPSGTSADSDILLLDLRTGESHVIVSRAIHGRYVRSGGSEYVLYALADGTVLAAPFNLRRRQVTGPAFAAVPDVQVAVFNGAALFAVADNGTLAFVRGSSTNLQLVKWVDRTGRDLGTIGPPLTATGAPLPLSLSPDGRRIAFTRRTPANNNLWLMETTSGQLERLTFERNEHETAVWSSEGRSVAYASTQERGVTWVYTRSVEGGSDTTLRYKATTHGHLSSWSPDGQWLLFNSLGQRLDVLAVPIDGGEPRAVAAEPSVAEESGQFAPDGRWIAFTSNETGRSEVYVISFPQLTGKRQVSIEGGRVPRWAHDGSTLYYQEGRRLMAVPVVSLQPSLKLGTARMLFEADFLHFDVAPDGQRFLLLTPNPEANRAEIHVVLNWVRELKEREKAGGK